MPAKARREITSLRAKVRSLQNDLAKRLEVDTPIWASNTPFGAQFPIGPHGVIHFKVGPDQILTCRFLDGQMVVSSTGGALYAQPVVANQLLIGVVNNASEVGRREEMDDPPTFDALQGIR